MYSREWKAIGRESALACNLIGSGVTNLGNASYANLGNYYTAFFCLSIGIERLAKLALVADYAIENSATMPSQEFLRNYGHNLANLLKKCEGFIDKHHINLKYRYDRNLISDKIIECLDAFAAATKGRYANFGELSNPTFGNEEPVKKWWAEVAELILQKKFRDTKMEEKALRDAELIGEVMSPAYVALSTEQGQNVSDVSSVVYRMREIKFVQKYGRFYTLITIRWLSEILCGVAQIAAHRYNIPAFIGLEEHYYGNYILDDIFLKNRKRWPILKEY